MAEVTRLCARKLLSGWSLLYISRGNECGSMTPGRVPALLPAGLCIPISSTGPCNSTQWNRSPVTLNIHYLQWAFARLPSHAQADFKPLSQSDIGVSTRGAGTPLKCRGRSYKTCPLTVLELEMVRQKARDHNSAPSHHGLTHRPLSCVHYNATCDE